MPRGIGYRVTSPSTARSGALPFVLIGRPLAYERVEGV
jgi:hypothetical protein